MKLALFSPLPPAPSGIADFVAELLPALAAQAELTLFTDDKARADPALRKRFAVYNTEDYDRASLRTKFDLAVFHLGNNADFHARALAVYLRHGGVLELHDVSLFHLMTLTTLGQNNAEAYARLMRYCHGEKGSQALERIAGNPDRGPWDLDPMAFPLNRQVLERASGIVVHSDFALQTVSAIAPGKMTETVLLHADALTEEEDPLAFQRQCREKLGVAQDCLMLGAFGYATASKRVPEILRALAAFRALYAKPFVFWIVGDTDPRLDVPGLVQSLGLAQHVKIAGRVPLAEFETLMGACDFCLNLRYPTQGESSASLHRMLGMGKPVILSRVGAFEEYPPDCALTVGTGNAEEQELLQALLRLAQAPETRKKMARSALAFAREHCALASNARRYIRFFEQIKAGAWCWSPRWKDHLADKFLAADFASPEQVSAVTAKLQGYPMPDYQP